MTAKKDSINTSAVDTGSEREDLFKSVVEESPFLICSFEPDGTIEFVNRAYSEYFGKDQAELVGENFFTQIPEGDRERVSATLAGLTPKAPSQCHEHRVKETGDQIQWIRWTNRALFDKKGRVTHFQSFGEDVTGRRLVEEKLRYQATLLEHISDTVISTDADFKILSWNEAAERIFGWKAEEAIGKRFPELTNLEFTDDTREGILEQLHQRGLWEGEVNQQRKDGKRISILSAVSAIKDSEGKLIGTVGTCKDITEQKAEMGQREKDLHDLGERNKELRCIHTISESIRLRESLDDVFQDTVNAIPPGWHYPEITRGRLRYNDKEWISEPFEETVWSQSCDIVVHGEKCGAVEVYYIEECPELDEGPFMKDERDLLDGIGRALSETVERRIADENLQGSESHLKRAQELTQSGSWKLDLVSDDLIWSDEIFRIFELPPDTRFDYEAFKDRVYHEDREFEKENWQAALHGKPYDIEFRIHTGNGVKWVREKADFEFDNTGQAVRATGIVQDITARKEAEIALEESYSRLLRAEQIAQMGFIDWDLKTDEVTLSPQARNLYGIDSDSQVTLEQVLALVHPDDQEYVGENLNLAIEGVQDYKIDHRMIRPDGEIFWVQARADLELDENGESAVLLGTVVDITERQRAVEALRTSEIKYRAIVEDQTELICRFRFDGTRATLTFGNDAYCRYFDM
jgi:PAS domain S-box-containing protein